MQVDFLIIFMPEQINPRVLPFWSVYPAVALECRERGQVKLARQPLPTANADAPWIQNGPLCLLRGKKKNNNNSNAALNIWCPPNTEATSWCQFGRSCQLHARWWPPLLPLQHRMWVFEVFFNFHVDCIIFFLLPHVVIVFLSSHLCYLSTEDVSGSISGGVGGFYASETHTCLSIIIPSWLKLSAACSLGNLTAFALGFCRHLLTLKYLNTQISALHLRLEQISGAWIWHSSPESETLWTAIINAALLALQLMPQSVFLIYNMLPSCMHSCELSEINLRLKTGSVCNMQSGGGGGKMVVVKV